jgi:hypothetical protein
MSTTKLAEAAKALLTACDKSVYTTDYCGLEVSKHDATQVTAAIEALREALEAKPAPAEPVAWAISYDGKTPYALWDYGNGALLDLEVKRLGGTWSKMPLYAAPAAPAPRNTDTHDHLSIMIGMVLGARQRGKMEYMDGSVMHKAVEAAIEHLNDWPYPEAAPAEPAPEPLTDADLLDLTPERDFGLTPEIEAYIVASMRAAIAKTTGEQA